MLMMYGIKKSEIQLKIMKEKIFYFSHTDYNLIKYPKQNYR